MATKSPFGRADLPSSLKLFSFETARGGGFEIHLSEERKVIHDFMLKQHVEVNSSFGWPKDEAIKMFPVIFSVSFESHCLFKKSFQELVEGNSEGDKNWNLCKVWKCVPVGSETVVGSLGIYEELNKDGVPIIYVSFWFVDKEYTNLKIGSKLWFAMMEFVKREILPYHKAPKYRTMTLITATDMYKKAYQYYLREGWKEYPCEYQSPRCNLVRMDYVFPEESCMPAERAGEEHPHAVSMSVSSVSS